MLVPTIRFPDFTGEYEERPLSDFLSENKEKNRQNLYTKEDVKSVSGDYGVVNQIEFFGKSMAGADVSNYHVVHHNNIVYTKSPLKANPYGIIKCNTGTDGIVSTLYAVYYCNDDVVPEYVDYYFGYDKRVNKYLLPLVNIGAKHDMKVNNQDAISGSVFFPSIDEQKKVVEALNVYDERVKNQLSVIEALETRRKGLLQQIFSQEIRFKADDGSEFPDWDSVIIEDAFDSISDKNHPDKTVLTIIQGQGTIPRDESDRNISYNKASIPTYKLVKKNDFIMHLRSFEGGLEIVTREGIVSPAYTILRNKVELVPEFYRYYFRSSSFIMEKLRGITEGIRDGRSINMDDFWLLEIPYPSIPEQRKIGQFMDLINRQIQIEKDKLEAIKLVKKGLLQQMFV